MIYEATTADEPIRQGDIFRRIPRVDLSLSTLAVIDDEDGARQVTWKEALEDGGAAAITAILPVRAVDGIVITQNCDAVRGEYLCLCQIDEFLPAIGQKDPPKSADKWQSLIVRKGREMPRIFYLPPHAATGFAQPMAADFRVILRIPRGDLESIRDHRVGRLNPEAANHFRETLAHFFRRYAFNEWYPLTKDEFAAYSAACPEPVKPYPWQE